jgi:hypothetical protein
VSSSEQLDAPNIDPLRRRLLRVGASFAALPLLVSCGSESPDAAIDEPEPGGPTEPAPQPPTPEPPVATLPPRGLHASWIDDPTSTRTLTWFTDGTRAPDSYLEYGPVENGMNDTDIASAPFPQRTLASRQATYGVEAITHTATATNLAPDKAVRYRVGSAEGWSAVHVLPAAPNGRFRFAHFGDHALSEFSKAVVAGVAARAPDFAIIAGDLSYANGDQPVWDRYFDMLEPLAARLPVMTCPGNHEAKDGGGEGYRSRLSMPGEDDHYGFDYGRVHFYFSTGGSLLDGLAGAGALAAELLAIELDLARAALRRARGEIDFIVFVQHYTIWTSEDGRDPANFTLVALEEQILLRYGVDLLLVGHDHIYERSKPMAYGRPFANGYVQLTQGGGGQTLYELVDDIADWSVFATLRYGFSELEVDGDTIRITSYAVDDEQNRPLPNGELRVIDQFEIRARGTLASAAFALPARTRKQLLPEIDAVVRHTARRNALHDAGEHLPWL